VSQPPTEDSGASDDYVSDAYVTVLEGVDEATLLVAKSLLLDAGIPFIAKGERLQDLVEPGRIGTNFSIPLGTVKLQVHADDADEAREILQAEEDKPGSEDRVRELERKLLAEVIWFAAFLLSGLLLSYLIVPGTWDEGERRLIYAISAICMAFVGAALRKSSGSDQATGGESLSDDEESIRPSTNRRKYGFPVLLVLAILGLLVFSHYRVDTETDGNINRSYSTKEIKKGLENYKKAIARNPNNASYQYGAARLYLMLKSPKEALPLLNRCIELKPARVDCFCYRGLTHYQLGEYDQAIKDFTRAIELDPHHEMITDVHRNRAAAFYAAGRYLRAIEEYDRAIDLDPQSSEAYLFRGQSYERLMHDHRRAIMDYEKAVELDPKDARNYIARGSAYEEIGRYDAALGDFEKGIAVNPKHPGAYNNLAWLLATCKDASYRNSERAVRYAQKAVELAEKGKDSELAEYYDTSAAAYAEAGYFDKAVLMKSKACALYKPGNADDTQIECEQLLEAYKGKQTYNQWESMYHGRK
jgi:tetratricopeptide (TPR) repeat protein